MTAAASPPLWARLASFAVPFALAAVCAGNDMGFYDSPELTAAGAGLGVTHPPGHPLWVALAAIAALVPVGAAPLRLALLSAVCLGLVGRLALGTAWRLVGRITDAQVPAPWLAACSLAGALYATMGPGTLRQASRVEVYALAGVFAAGLLWLGSRSREPSAPRARVGAVILGLGLANHHFIALTAAPLWLWVAAARAREARTARGRWPLRTLAAWAASVAPGLALYALLPLRAHAPSSLPRVHSWSELLEVASARTFAKSAGSAAPGEPSGRVLDVVDWLGETLTPVGLLFAACGLYLAVRTPEARRDAARLGLLVLVVVAARAYLGFSRDNPDAAGYLVPAVLALGVAAAAFPAGALRALRDAPPAPTGPGPAARALLFALLVIGPFALPGYLAFASHRASAVDRTYVPSEIAQATLAPLPPRAVLFAYDPQSIFRLRYATLVEGARPDVTIVPVPLLGYPGAVGALLADGSELGPVMTQYLLRPDQGLSPTLLSALATRRTVVIELDPRNVQDNVATILPRGPVAQIMPEPTTLASVRGAAAAHFNRIDHLAVQLDREPAAAPLANEVLLWRAYLDALFFAARGARPEARRSVAQGLARSPEARELHGLRDALAQGDGPLDVRPFLPAAAP